MIEMALRNTVVIPSTSRFGYLGRIKEKQLNV